MNDPLQRDRWMRRAFSATARAVVGDQRRHHHDEGLFCMRCRKVVDPAEVGRHPGGAHHPELPYHKACGCDLVLPT